MIDIHAHVLPGLDDGPRTMEQSIALARAVSDAGTAVVVATPHIRQDHRFPAERVAPAADELNACLGEAGIPLRVLPAGELSIAKAAEFDEAALTPLALGAGPYILVESPYTHLGGLLETTLFDLQVKGFRPVLAHPERSPSFQRDRHRLVELVRTGMLCSVTASSFTGRFGKTVRRNSLELLRSGMVHNIASDTHDLASRRPEIGPGLVVVASETKRTAGYGAWLTEEVPAAMLAGERIPARPRPTRRWGSIGTRRKLAPPLNEPAAAAPPASPLS
jgi:protein-tyrosine phosphatase